MLLGEVKAAIANACAGIAGLNVLAFEPMGAANEPFFCTSGAEIDPNITFGGSDKATITCYIMVSRGGDGRTGQLLLDQFLSRSGAKSIRAALDLAHGDPGELALDGTCDDFKIVGIRGYQMYDIGATKYYGAEIIIEVWGS